MSYTAKLLLRFAEGQQFKRQQLFQQYQQQQPPKLVKISDNDASLETLAHGQQFDQQQLLQQYEQQQLSRLWKISDNDTSTDTLAQGQQFDYQQLTQQYQQQQPPRLFRISDRNDAFANIDTSIKEQSQDSSSIIPCKPTGFLMYIPATSPDSSTMVEHMCTLALSKQQVTTYQQRVNDGSVPFPSQPYSALPLPSPKPAAFSDNYQPHVDNESAFSVIPDQSLNRADPQQQVNGSWQGNVHGNSESTSSIATHAATNGIASPYPSTTSPCQPLSPTSPTQPSQPPQQGQSAQPIGTGLTTRKKRRCVSCTSPNCDKNRNKGLSRVEKRHICHYSGCGKAYEKPYQLQNHLRRHRGEKPFICNWLSCGKRFVSLDGLQHHKYTHTSEKKYVCKVCSKKFKQKCHMMQHVHANRCRKETRQV